MRILHVLDHSIPLHSGYAFRTLSILTHQRAMGWQTFHLTTPKHTRPYAPAETIDGWDFFRPAPPQGRMAGLPVLGELAQMRATTARLREVAAEIRPDIVHAHSPVLNALPALTIGRERGIPVVYEVRAFWEDAGVSHGTYREWGLRYRMTRMLETYALRRADAVTTICEGLRRDIVARGIPAAKVTVIPNAVDLETFAGGAAREAALMAALGLAGRTVLGFLGSFYRYEGLDLAIRAMPEILAARPDVSLLLVGGGEHEAELKTLAASLGLGGQVVFAGRVHFSEVRRYYALVDVLVYPRVNIRLTDLVTPLKPLEAMAQDKIVLASDVGGHNELITDGVTGTLFRADDPAALAERVLEVLARRESWPEQRARGRRYVEDERNWPRAVARYKGVYEPLLAA